MNTDSVTIFLDKSPFDIANQLITAITDNEKVPSQEAIGKLREIAAYIHTWSNFRHDGMGLYLVSHKTWP